MIIILVLAYLLIGLYITVCYIKEIGEGPSTGYIALTLFWPIFLIISACMEPDVLDRFTPLKYIKKFYEYLVDKL
jgi:hypothetical protein